MPPRGGVRRGWLHSGDLGRQAEDGFFHIVDRKKDMIISCGENIYCAEVEHAIMDHPVVAEIAIIGRADERWGEVAVLQDGMRLSIDELVAFFRPHLAPFKHPKDLIVVDQMPRNASNKIRKNVLREAYGSPDSGLNRTPCDHRSPEVDPPVDLGGSDRSV